MKKPFCVVMLIAVIFNTLSCASATAITPEFSITLDTQCHDNVMLISASELSSETDYNKLSDFVESGGILVVEHDTDTTVNIGEQLGMNLCFSPASDSSNLSNNNRKNHTDAGIDIATIYYEYGDGLKGTYKVNVGTNNVNSVDRIITEVIDEIRNRQQTYAYMESSTEILRLGDEVYYAVHLNTLDTTTVREPKGRITARYKLYSVENYFDEDFYIIKAKYDATPGYALAGSNPLYESRYKGKELFASIGTSTSSVAVDEYGPYTADNTTSYGVDISGSLDTDNIAGVSVGFSWSRTINSVDIAANRFTRSAEWDVTLHSNAQKTTFTFEPGVTFDCPTGKPSISFNVYAAYTVDALFTSAEDIIIDEDICCTINSANFD